MENTNTIINQIYTQKGIKQQNFNNTVIIKRSANIDNNINEYPNSVVYGYKQPINIDINIQIDNVHAKNTKNNSQKDSMNDALIDLSNQNQNIFNYNYIHRKANPHKKIIVQKIINKQNQKQRIIPKKSHHFPYLSKLSGDNIFHISHENTNISSDSISNNNSQTEENKKFKKASSKHIKEKISTKSSFDNGQNYSKSKSNEVKSNYQYIIKNHKTNIENGKIDMNNNIKDNYLKSNSSEMNINGIREELRLIHDNRKYNYDKKVQKINPNKIHVSQSKKIVERMLGLNSKKIENNKNKEEGNKSMYEIKSHPLQKINIPYNIDNNETNQNIINNNIKQNKNNVMTPIMNINMNPNLNLNNNIKNNDNNIVLNDKQKINHINNDLNSYFFSQQNIKNNQIKINTPQINIVKDQKISPIIQNEKNKSQNIVPQTKPNAIPEIDQKLNINAQYNNQFPPSMGKIITPQKNILIPFKHQISNPIPQQAITIDTKDKSQINYNLLKSQNISNNNNIINIPNKSLSQRSASPYIISSQKIQDISPTNFNLQKSPVNELNLNINMIHPQQNPYIIGNNLPNNQPNGNKDNFINVVVKKISPNLNLNINQNRNNNIIQQPPILNIPNNNINLIQQPAHINYISQNPNISPQQQNIVFHQEQSQQQPNMNIFHQNILEQSSKIDLNQNISCPQNDNRNNYLNLNLKLIKNKNAISDNSNIFQIQNENIQLNQLNPQNMNIIPNSIGISMNANSINNLQPNFQNQNYSTNIYQNVQNINNQQIINSQNQNNINQVNNPLNKEQLFQMQQVPDNTIIGNIIIKNGKAYYLNQFNNNQNKNNNMNMNMNNNISQNPLNNYIQPETASIQQNYNNQNPINNNMVCTGNTNEINNNQFINNQNQLQGNIINNCELNKDATDPQNQNQQSQIQEQNNNNSEQKIRNEDKINKKEKTSRTKDSNDHRPALQYKVERCRPVFAVPPSKKRALSQGRPFNFIHKYYDENYILEDDDEESIKQEETTNIKVVKNNSSDEDINNKK